MGSCCYGDEYGEVFTEGEAERSARRFARRGLPGPARRLVEALEGAGVDDAEVLEIGGGVGTIGVALLEAGAGRVVNVDLSPTWEAPAERLLTERGLGDRVERRIGDVVDLADELPRADVVVAHRVVCCYPDWQAMLSVAAAKSTRLLGLTFPVDRWWTRLAAAGGNLVARLRGSSFRGFIHPPSQMLAFLAGQGFEPVVDRSSVVWRTVVLSRHPLRGRSAGNGIG